MLLTYPGLHVQKVVFSTARCVEGPSAFQMFIRLTSMDFLLKNVPSPECMCRGRLNCLIDHHSPPILVQELLFLFRNSYSRSGTQTTPPGRRTSKFYWWSWSDSDTLSRHITSLDFTSNMLLLRFVVVVVVTSNTRLHHWMFLELDIGIPYYVLVDLTKRTP